MTFLAIALRESSLRAASALVAAGMGLLLLLIAAMVRKRQGSRRYLACLTAGTVSFAAAIAVAIGAIHTGRLNVLRATLPGASERDAHTLYLGIQLQILGIALVGGITLLFAFVWALVRLMARRWRSGWRPLAGSSLAAAPLLPLLAVAAGALVYGLRLGRAFTDLSWSANAIKELRLYQALEGAQVVLGWARLGLGGAVALAVGIAVAASRPANAVGSPPRNKAAAAFLLACGLAAFLLSRGHAADGAPLPLLPGGTLDVSQASKLPRVSSCPLSPQPAPVLEFEAEVVRFNRVAVDPGQFRDQLEVFRRNYPLLYGRPAPPLLVTVLADPATSLARIIPYLERADTGEVQVASAVPRDHQSHVLGRIERYEYCGRPFLLSIEGRALSSYTTWSQLSTAMEQSRAPLVVAAR
jgi:hypothetical protein